MLGIRIALAALLCAPLMVHAAGLGRLTVHSALGQPLRAEIEVVSLQAGEEDSLQARLATMDAFRQAGIELSGVLVGLQFTIDRRGGRPIIRLSTSQPVNEPFLDLLVELSWSTGRLVREYTFLIDPQDLKGPAPAAAAPAPAPVARPAPEPAAKPAPRTEARPIPAAPAAAATGAKQHEVKKGDTLGAIARQNLPEGVTLNQMLMALYRANEGAFIRGNINLVRAGRILNIPDREAIVATGAADARRQVQSQMADFAEYKRNLGQAVAAAPAATRPEREVTGRITTKPEAPAPAEQKDQLKLSKADPKQGSAAARAAREDDRVARERALKDTQSRVSELEKNNADLQKLLAMKNQQMADLEKKAAAKPPAPAAAPAPVPPPAPAPAAKAPEPAKEAPKEAPKVAAKDAPKEAAKEAPKEAPKDAAKEAPKEAAKDAGKEAPKDVAQDAAKKKPAAIPVKAAADKSFLEEFIEDPIALA